MYEDAIDSYCSILPRTTHINHVLYVQAMDKLPFAVLQQYVNLSLAESSASTDSDRGGLVGTARLVRGGELLGLHDIGSSLFPRDRVDVSRFPLVLPISIDERTVDSFFHSSTAAAATAQTVTEKDSNKEESLFSTPERKSVSNPREDESTSSSNNALRKGAAIFSPSGGSSMNGVGKVLDISMVSPIKKTAGVFSPRANGVANEAHGDEKDSDGPVHLIVLQHGFLGCSYDMRLLQNAMKVELPPNTQVMASIYMLFGSQQSSSPSHIRMYIHTLDIVRQGQRGAYSGQHRSDGQASGL
jgi:hypothetical protein